ncbi:DUF3883 domain-containing protein [Sinorhizobium meliloti]|nr:DUF3883 domain-containing protein [Sinorhizobium meliloti]MDX0212043.1 DUF3883 domain-containing protein [Sinorhizobium meliloti]
MTLSRSQYAEWLIGEIEAATPKELVHLKKVGPNRLTISLNKGGHILRYRVLMYAVGAAFRENPLERRVEITSTYAGGLKPLGGHVDVVLGVEREKRLLVGIDPRRLHHGGKTHNASTFVYLPSFENLSGAGWLPLQVQTHLIDTEYQIYLEPRFLTDYLSNHASLHASGISMPKAASTKNTTTDLLDEYSARGSKTKLTYEQQLELALKKMQIGRLGEGIVYESEKSRLTKSMTPLLAKQVNWVSQSQPYLGYDIASYGTGAIEEFIEVKASVSKLRGFYFTENEMRVAKDKGDAYRLVCVSSVMTQPLLREFRNPIKAISEGKLVVERDTSFITIKA